MTDITIAIVSPGNMGAAIGARLVANGIKVVTPTGRSSASEQRARKAGMTFIKEAGLGEVDFLFSIVPPDRAVETARNAAPFVGSGSKRPLYIDWNAIGVERVREIERIILAEGGRFADGSIIGLPPTGDKPGPVLYTSGHEASNLSKIENRGVRFRIMDAEVGAASALKLSYAGITKGLIALGSAMLLAAERAGCEQALLAELGASQPHLLASFQKGIPDMFSKARRWVPELDEIATFIGPERSESGIYDGISQFYADLAVAFDADGAAIAKLDSMLRKRSL
jgi:L-threonate 2-dehydrogenase